MTTYPKGALIQVQETIDNLASTVVFPSTGSTPIKGGPDVSITPKKSDSLIKISGKINIGMSQSTICTYYFYKDGALLSTYAGETRGNRTPASGNFHVSSNNRSVEVPFEFYDEPGDTSEHTYEIRFSSFNGETNYINRAQTDTNVSTYTTAVSTIRAEEYA